MTFEDPTAAVQRFLIEKSRKEEFSTPTVVEPDFDLRFTIIRPITSCVFGPVGSYHQKLISEYCDEHGIELCDVLSVGLLGSEILSIDVRAETDAFNEPEPDPSEANYGNKFKRWAEIQRYKQELARLDAPEPTKRAYTRRAA